MVSHGKNDLPGIPMGLLFHIYILVFRREIGQNPMVDDQERTAAANCIVGYAYHQQYRFYPIDISPQNNAWSNNIWFGEKQGQPVNPYLFVA